MIAVIGMGYAGRMALSRIRAAGLEAVAIDPLASPVERTRLHEAAARGRPVEIEIGPWLLGLGVEHRRASAVSVRPSLVGLDDGSEIRCDGVILAAGSVPDDRGIAGVREIAHRLESAPGAAILHQALRGARRVAVVGAGLTGIEAATEVAEAHPELQVTLVGEVTSLSPRGEAAVARALSRRAIERAEASVTSLSDGRLETSRGEIQADVVIWAAGLKAPGWLASAGLPVDSSGRVKVSDALQVEGMEGVFAAGDCAASSLRMACATAMPLGCHAADNMIRLMQGKEVRPMSFSYMLRCISLGRSDALIQGTSADDAPTWAVSGKSAAIVKETILKAAASMHKIEAATGLPLYGWPRGPRGRISAAPAEIA